MSGNGVDLAAIYQAILAVSADVRAQGKRLDAVEGKLNDLDGKVDGLRQAVTAYHASVLGHGILISELDDRVRRIEQRLGLSPVA